MNIDNLLVGTIPLMLVIFGLVEFIKSLGLKGTWLTVLSLLLGLGFGMAFRVSSFGVPIGFTGWFEAVVFGLAIGLTTSGFYKFIDARLPEVN
jgi:hypothetical protein